MKTIAMVTLSALVASTGEGFAGQKVPLDQLPPAVRAAVETEMQGGKLEDVERKVEGGKTLYEVDVIKDGHEVEVKIAEDGTVLARQREDREDEGEPEDDDDDDDGEADDR
jgi:hypothetical protein